MEIEKLAEPLSANDIDFRIQSISKSGWATILAYKDARVDMNRLDEIVGHFNWKKSYTRDNKNCIVSIYDNTKKERVPKEDTGTESNTQKEKGLASDSFKRACFNWGIGRELYDYPHMLVQLRGDEFEEKGGKCKQTFKLKLKEWKWTIEFKDKKIVRLLAKDENGKLRYELGKFITISEGAKQTKQSNNTPPKKELPRFEDGNLTNLQNLTKEGQKFTLSDIRKKYKIAKRYNDDLSELGIK